VSRHPRPDRGAGDDLIVQTATMNTMFMTAVNMTMTIMAIAALRMTITSVRIALGAARLR